MKDKLVKWTQEHPVATTNICFGLVFVLGYRAGMRKGYKMCISSVDYALGELGKVFTIGKI